MKKYDVLVIGGGCRCRGCYCGCRIGANTALISFKKTDLGVMSCNPAMGGLGKGHLIREIDAMGGVIGIASVAQAYNLECSIKLGERLFRAKSPD